MAESWFALSQADRVEAVGPDVRKISRVGTCVVSPSALASAAPLGTTTSPWVDAMASTTALVEGGRKPKRLV